MYDYLYQEHIDHEFGASFDDVRERYAGTEVDPATETDHEADAADFEAFWSSPTRPHCAYPRFMPAKPFWGGACCESGGPDDILF